MIMLMQLAHGLVVLGVLSAAVVKDVKLGDSVTLPCKHHGNEDTPVEQLDLQWWLGEQLVRGLIRGQISYGINYRNRTALPEVGSSRGDFSLTITHTQHGDSGVYRCLIKREDQDEPLGEVELRVKAPRYPSAVFVKVGEEVVLPCFGRVDWWGSDAELVRWNRGDLDQTEEVLQWEKGSLYVNPQFALRASVHKEGIQQDYLSLVLKNTRHQDKGPYSCLFVKDQKIQRAAQVNLTVTDHMTQVRAGFGSSVLLPLHTTSAVSVWFLPDGGNDTVQVCVVEEDQLKCETAYTHRTLVNNDSLELKNLLLLDSGTFFVMERESQRTVSVLFLQVFATHPLPSIGKHVMKADLASVMIITAVFLVIAMTTVIITVQQKKWSRWWRAHGAASKSQQMDHSDATSIKVSSA